VEERRKKIVRLEKLKSRYLKKKRLNLIGQEYTIRSREPKRAETEQNLACGC